MRGRGEARNEPGRWLLLFLLLLLTLRVQAQPPLVVSPLPDATSLKLKGAFGYVHTATGKLPEPSTEPLETLIARAEQGEIRLAVVGEPLRGLPKIRRLWLIEPGVPEGSTVTSPSTRTLGLVTAADLVGEGRPIEIVRWRHGLRQAMYFGAQLEAGEASKIPLLLLWAGTAGLGLGLASAALRFPKLRQVAQLILLVATAATGGLLVAGSAPETLYQIALFPITTGGFLAVTAFAGLGRHLKTTDILKIFIGVIICDTLFRWNLVACSPLSGYYDSGIRFYGIGNEYMGLLIGAALMSVPKKWLGWVGLGITLLLGLPMLGANAGGAMAACVAFFPPSKKSWWRVGLPFVVVFALAGLDRLLPGVAQSHIGQAAGKGPSAWGEIILRKLAMNARLTVAGPTLLALGVAAVVGWQLRKPFARLESELQGRVVQALWGAGAAIAFNDSGTVAALLLLAPVLVVCLEKSLPSPTESAAAS